MQTAPISAVGRSSPELTARGSPKRSEKVCSAYSVLMLRKSDPTPSKVTRANATTTSLRPRRPQEAMATHTEKGEDPDAEESTGADQRRSCRARESSLGNGVGGKRRPAQDDEEADGASHHGHHGGFEPRVDHETREQARSAFPSLRAQPLARRRRHARVTPTADAGSGARLILRSRLPASCASR